jgi:hypothetical protein
MIETRNESPRFKNHPWSVFTNYFAHATLDDLDVIAGGILGWQQREGGAGSELDIDDMAGVERTPVWRSFRL